METTKALLFSITLVTAAVLSPAVPTFRRPSITAVFAFGDSILDAGNNNALPTIFRADHPPYGVNFPGGVPTGRFCDGMLATDIIVSDLGLKRLLPAYLDRALTDEGLLTGASFASAGSGLDESTARQVNVLSLNSQLANFREAVGRMRRTAGHAAAGQAVENALFMVAAGSNDMLYNCYGMMGIRRNCSVSAYHGLLLGNLERFIRELVNMGARRLAIMGLPPIGCLPVQVTIANFRWSSQMRTRTCIDLQNFDSLSYNMRLQFLMVRLQTSLPFGTRLAYVDVYTPLLNMIRSPAIYGFEKTTEGCCGHGYVEMGPLCNALTQACPNASRSVFWDAVHPTQATYAILARQFLLNMLPILIY